MPKKIFSVIFCAVLIFTALPLCASAEEFAGDYVDGEVIIKYNHTAAPGESLVLDSSVPDSLAECGITSVKELKMQSVYDTSVRTLTDSSKVKTTVYLAQTSLSVEKTCSLLKNADGVISSSPNYLFEFDSVEMPEEITNPTNYFSRYSDWWFNGIVQVPDAWNEFETFGEGTVIAILDSGIYVDNPEFAENIWEDSAGHRGYNAAEDTYDVTPDTSHGSNVSGIAAASAGNNMHCIGVAPKAKIMPIKVSVSPTSLTLGAVITGINYAITNHADIISMSLSTPDDQDILHDACSAAYDAGIIVVASAGNNNSDAANMKRYPAAYDCVIAVMAMGKDGQLCNFSNYDSTGNYYDIAAPGYVIMGPGDSPSSLTAISGMSGTSQATPIISGLAALYLSVYPDHTPEEFRRALLLSSTDTCTSNSSVVTDTVYTYPVANALKLLRFPNTTPSISSVPGTTTVIDNNNYYIHGLSEGYENVGDYISVNDGTYEFIPTINGNGTGSILRIYTLSGEAYRDYTIIIFGDTDGDAKCDGRDVIMCDYILSGGSAPEYTVFAADVDFDDSVTDSDSAIIFGCGIFIDYVDQIR